MFMWNRDFVLSSSNEHVDIFFLFYLAVSRVNSD